MPDRDQVRRAQAERLRFLLAIYDREDRGEQWPDVQDLVADLGMDPTDWARIQRITEPLTQDGLIQGPRTAEHGIVKARLLPAGRAAVEAHVVRDTPPERAARASIGSIRIDGSGNIINLPQHSPGAQQSAQFTAYELREIRRWVQDVESRVEVHGVQGDDLADVQQNAAELRQELDRPAPDQGKISALGQAILRILEGTAGNLASMGLVEAGQDLFS
jgi:hypothetical protein